MASMHKAYYDVAKFTIWADSLDESSAKRARFVLSFRDGNPRFIVYTGGTGPESVIVFPSDLNTMLMVNELLIKVIEGEPGTKYSVQSLTNHYVDNKPTDEKKLVSTLYVGKTKEGVVFFSVISENKPKLVFPIKSSMYHKFFDSSKEPISDAEVSMGIARGISKLLVEILSISVMKYTDDEYAGLGRKPTDIQGFGAPTAKKASALVEDFDDIAM